MKKYETPEIEKIVYLENDCLSDTLGTESEDVGEILNPPGNP